LAALTTAVNAGNARQDQSDLKLDNLDRKVEQYQTEVNAKLAALATAQSSSSSSGAGVAAAPLTSSTTRPPPRAAPAAAAERSKVFFDGPTHALHRGVLGRYWNDTVKPMVHADLVAGTRPYIGNRDTFAVDFPSEAAANIFLDALTVLHGAPSLLDPDGLTHTMTAQLQRSKVPTKYGKRLSPIYLHYREKLRDRPGWPGNCKLVADAHGGRVYVEKGEKLFMIHTLNVGGASLRTHGGTSPNSVST
jgi:hypothetical protein